MPAAKLTCAAIHDMSHHLRALCTWDSAGRCLGPTNRTAKLEMPRGASYEDGFAKSNNEVGCRCPMCTCNQQDTIQHQENQSTKGDIEPEVSPLENEWKVLGEIEL